MGGGGGGEGGVMKSMEWLPFFYRISIEAIKSDESQLLTLGWTFSLSPALLYRVNDVGKIGVRELGKFAALSYI